MQYLKISEAAQLWNLSDRRIRVLCEQGKIYGVIRQGKAWKIPEGTKKPADGRKLRGRKISDDLRALFCLIETKKSTFNADRNNSFEADFVCNTLALSNISITKAQFESLFYNDSTPEGLAFSSCLMAFGLHNALNLATMSAKAGEKLSEQLIKELHSLMCLGGQKALYRKYDSVAGQKNMLIPMRIKRLLDEHEKADKSLHAVEAAALICAKILAVKPFDNANAELSMLLANFTLQGGGYPLIYISETSKEHFFKAVADYNNEGNIISLCELFGELINNRF